MNSLPIPCPVVFLFALHLPRRRRFISDAISDVNIILNPVVMNKDDEKQKKSFLQSTNFHIFCFFPFSFCPSSSPG